MLDQFKNFLPFVYFTLGVTGSAHCLGMCGPLILASAKNKKENVVYQTGRLFGYLTITSLISLIGIEFIKSQQSTLLYLSSFLIGLIFIISGLKLLLKININLSLSFYQKIIQKLLSKFLRISSYPYFKNLILGYFSAFLPCGLLYTVLISALALIDYKLSLIAVLSFWFGTLPALIIAPSFINKILKPFLSKLPTFSGILLILVGITFLVQRSLNSSQSMDKVLKTKVNILDPNCHEK